MKSRRSDRHVTSDWLEMEQERGSPSQHPCSFRISKLGINLLDTLRHREDFSEDTYRALDSGGAGTRAPRQSKGVEVQTQKTVQRLQKAAFPIYTFVNKCDRIGEDLPNSFRRCK